MKTYKELLSEKWVASYKIGWMNNKTDVYYNPTRKELKQWDGHCDMYLLSNGNAYAWGNAMHYDIEKKMNELDRTAIPVQLYYNGREVMAVVTDSSKRGMWHHNNKVADIIRKHKYLNKMFSKIEVSYYDEMIVGSWEEM